MPRVRRCRYPNCHAYAYVPNHYCKKHIKHEKEYLDRRKQYHTNKYTTWHYNHITRYRNKTKANQNHFYHTKKWRDLRAVVLDRDYSICQYCKANSGNIVDHVVPIEIDPTKTCDLDNLVTCCRDCHRLKTKWEQSYYGTGLRGTKTDNPALTDTKRINKLMNAL